MDAEAPKLVVPIFCADKKAPCPHCGKKGNLQRVLHREVRTLEDPEAGGAPLTYWQNWNGPADSPDGLVLNEDGRCGAWAGLFVDVLRAWGGNFNYQANLKQIVIDDQNTPVQATAFQVRNWAFGNPNVLVPPPPRLAGYLWYNEVGDPFQLNNAPQNAPPNWRFNWQGQPAVTYLGGSAQNNDNPLGGFLDHVVVRIGNIIYDPSYGVTYAYDPRNPNTRVAGFANAALGAMMTVIPFDERAAFSNFDLNGDGQRTAYWVALFKPVDVTLIRMR